MDKTLELIKLAQNGDKNAKQRLVEENTGLIWSIVRRFMNRGYDPEDLFQIGSIGILKCIEKFDMNYEVKFSTYAVPTILGEIKRFLRDDGMIKVSRPLKEIAQKAKYMEEMLAQKTGRQPKITEVAEAIGVQVEDLIVAMEASREIESLYATTTQGEGSPVYLIDKLNQEKDYDDKMVDSIALKQIISQLNPRERQVIMMRYYHDKTQTEVAAAIGVSQVQVSRIEKKVLKDMRDKFG